MKAMHHFRMKQRYRQGAKDDRRFGAITLTAMALSIGGIVLVAACADQEPTTVSQGQAQDIVRSMRFVRHPQAHDLCIGYVYINDGVSNAATGGPAMIEVDCAKVEHLLVPTEAPSPSEAPH